MGLKDCGKIGRATDSGKELWRKAATLLENSEKFDYSRLDVMNAREIVRNARKVLIKGGYKPQRIVEMGFSIQMLLS